MNTELLPCPFCGGEAEMEFNEESVTIYCTTCESEIKRKISLEYSAKDECIKAWNLRAEKTYETPVKLGQTIYWIGDGRIKDGTVSKIANYFAIDEPLYPCCETFTFNEIGKGFFLKLEDALKAKMDRKGRTNV